MLGQTKVHRQEFEKNVQGTRYKACHIKRLVARLDDSELSLALPLLSSSSLLVIHILIHLDHTESCLLNLLLQMLNSVILCTARKILVVLDDLRELEVIIMNAIMHNLCALKMR